MRVLNQLLDVLSQSIKVWDTFSSPNGDIGYFSDVDTSTGKLHSNILVSLRGIKETIDALETLKDKLELLEKGCCKFAEAVSPEVLHKRISFAVDTSSSNSVLLSRPTKQSGVTVHSPSSRSQ